MPIYWLNGKKVADDYADFYDGTWDNENKRKNESGNANTLTQAWTGSNHNGTKFVDPNTVASHVMGTSNPRVGKLTSLTLKAL